MSPSGHVELRREASRHAGLAGIWYSGGQSDWLSHWQTTFATQPAQTDIYGHISNWPKASIGRASISPNCICPARLIRVAAWLSWLMHRDEGATHAKPMAPIADKPAI